MDASVNQQPDLFGGLPAAPPGLEYQHDFLTVDEERLLLAAIRTLPLQQAEYRGYTAKRRIVSYGAGYDFDANELRPAPPIPAFLLPLRDRVALHLSVDARRLTHALVTEYGPGTALGWHRDVPDFEVVVGVSLAGACWIRFRPYPPQKGRRNVFALELAPRSLYLLDGAARWQWQHSIPPTRRWRYSITFRTLGKRARRPAEIG